MFNVGADSPISIGDLARLVIETTGSDASVRLVPYADAYPQGFEDLRHRRPDLSRIRDAIGWAPTIPLEQTIRDIAAALDLIAEAELPATIPAHRRAAGIITAAHANGTVSADKRTVTWTLDASGLADPAGLRQEVEFAAAPDLVLEAFGDAPAPEAAPARPPPAGSAPGKPAPGKGDEAGKGKAPAPPAKKGT